MKNLAVLVSGSGTNLQRIIDSIENGKIKNATIKYVIADRNCFALERALDANIETWIVDRDEELSQTLDSIVDNQVDYIVLAGFLSILSEEFCNKWTDKIINVHPSLLPKYGGIGMYGMKVHQAVIDNKETESGATVHFVTSGVDEGATILQKKVEVLPEDTAETLAAKIHEIEYEILPEAIQKLVNS